MRMREPLAPVLAWIFLLAGFAHSQVNVANRVPPEVSPDYSKEAYVIERYDMRVVMENDGSGTRELTARVKMLAEAGVKAFAVLSFTYTSANEVVDVDYVRVQKPDGTVVKTPDYNIQDLPADVTRTAPMYSDIHEKHVAVKGLGVGDSLEYLIRYRVVRPQVPGHFWFEDSFLKDAIVKEESLEVSVPSNKYVKVVSPEFKPEIKDEGGRRKYRWTHSNLEVKEKDANEIPRRIPPNPSVQLTTFASWADVGTWYGGLQKDSLEATPAVQAKAAELTKGLDTDDAKIRAIYNFVSLRFHYIGLDFGIGRYQPHPADDVLSNGYGDCKDKHTLLAALLKAAGYDAWPALIHVNRKLDADVPSPAQFNHVITVVPRGDQRIWLDTTPEVAPYGLLLTLLRDTETLVIPSDKPPVLMKTPADAPVPQQQSFTVEGKLGSDGTFTGHVEQIYRGDVEVLLRSVFRQASQSQWKQVAQGFSSRLGFGGDVSNVQVSPPEEMDKPFRFSYDYVRKEYSDWEHRRFSPPLPSMGFEAAKDQKEPPPDPLLLGAVGEIVYRSSFVVPPGYLVMAPKNVDLVEPYVEYHATASLQNGEALITSRRLVIKKPEVPFDEWEKFKVFAKAMSDDEWQSIALNGTSGGIDGNPAKTPGLDEKFREAYTAMGKGDNSRAKELFEQVIAGDPRYPMVHTNLGTVLMIQNKPTEAIAEWHKEQEVNPDDLRAFQVPAIHLAHVGRKDEAIEEWRRLLKVDAKNHDAALAMSQLLVSEAKYREAIEALETAAKFSPDSPTLRIALGETYVDSGSIEKGVPLLRKAVEEQNDHDPMMLNEIAYDLAKHNANLDLAKEYAGKALTDLDKRSVGDADSVESSGQVAAQLAAVWDTMGWICFRMGDAIQAENYVRPAWELGQASIIGNHLGQIYEKLGKTKDAARTYELAWAALPPVSMTPAAALDSAKSYDESRDDISDRYKRLTGKVPSAEIRRLPNGEWTKTPFEELGQMRAVRLGKLPGVMGSAEFSILFAPEKIESVQYLSGNESLKTLTEKLKSSHYQVEFPTGSKAKLLRRIELSCTPTVGCMAVLVPPDRRGPGQYLGR